MSVAKGLAIIRSSAFVLRNRLHSLSEFVKQSRSGSTKVRERKRENECCKRTCNHSLFGIRSPESIPSQPLRVGSSYGDDHFCPIPGGDLCRNGRCAAQATAAIDAAAPPPHQPDASIGRAWARSVSLRDRSASPIPPIGASSRTAASIRSVAPDDRGRRRNGAGPATGRQCPTAPGSAGNPVRRSNVAEAPLRSSAGLGAGGDGSRRWPPTAAAPSFSRRPARLAPMRHRAPSPRVPTGGPLPPPRAATAGSSGAWASSVVWLRVAVVRARACPNVVPNPAPGRKLASSTPPTDPVARTPARGPPRRSTAARSGPAPSPPGPGAAPPAGTPRRSPTARPARRPTAARRPVPRRARPDRNPAPCRAASDRSRCLPRPARRPGSAPPRGPPCWRRS